MQIALPIQQVEAKEGNTVILKGSVHGEAVEVLFDTGANISGVSTDLARKLQCIVCTNQQTIHVKGISNNTTTTNAYTHLEINFDKDMGIASNFWIWESLPIDIIVGTDIMQNIKNFWIDVNNKVVWMDGEETTSKEEPEEKTINLTKSKNLFISAANLDWELIIIEDEECREEQRDRDSLYISKCNLPCSGSADNKDGQRTVSAGSLRTIQANIQVSLTKVGMEGESRSVNSNFQVTVTREGMKESQHVSNILAGIAGEGIEEKLLKMKMGEINEDQKKQLFALLRRYQSVFMKKRVKYDKNLYKNRIPHKIILKDGYKPRMQQPRRTSKLKDAFIKKTIKENLEDGIIEPSTADCTSPVVVAPKPGSSDLRFCVDYRELNAHTVKDPYPIPRIDEIVEWLAGATYISELDLTSAFWQILLDEDSKHLTTFTCRFEIYLYNVMSFGLCNATPTQQRNEFLRRHNLQNIRVYIVNIIIKSNSFEEYLYTLEAFLKVAEEENLILKLEKSKLLFRKIKMLGLAISGIEITPDEDKIASISKIQRPRNLKELQRLLGMMNYYRKFIKNFAIITEPLRRLLTKENSKHVGRLWNEDCQLAVDKLKKTLASNIALAQYNHSNPNPLVLTVDISKIGIGAILSQKQSCNGTWKEKPIAFASRSLKESEKNHTPTEMECLGLR
eukprot:TRINITY_DN7857_c0_g1_i2.p1 TRINITY_DN7857_c0_g1~~TRINITY_DN7857_c0_g1_i2.p1  ORF type:complete len:677 (+),score=73.16 TRINITY_DN7857_c0_g1_i2:1357-3387(+)